MPPPGLPCEFGGIDQGAGTSCLGDEACWKPDGTCITADAICCDDLGGTPLGPGTSCSVLYVDDDATPPGDGASWNTAFAYLQDALAAASVGTEIRVAQGTYRPDERNAGWSMGRQDRFKLRDHVSIWGGYAGQGAGDPDERDPGTYETILSGDLDDDDASLSCTSDADCSALGSEARCLGAGICSIRLHIDDNSCHVVVYNEPNAVAILDGVTVSGGNADQQGTCPDNQGGAVLIRRKECAAGFNQGQPCQTSFQCPAPGRNAACVAIKCIAGGPTLRNCVFADNYSLHHGAVNDHASDTVIDSCTFIRNQSGPSGQAAALQVHSGSPSITDCVFMDNTSGADGAAMGADGAAIWCGHDDDATCSGGGFETSAATITACSFTDNRAGNRGGAIFNDANTSPSISGSTFTGNVADGSGGGGIWNEASSASILDCTFTDNHGGTTLGDGGGAVYNNGDAPVTVDDCTFTDNSGPGGGAIYNKGNYLSHSKINGSHFSGNLSSSNYGGAVYLEGSYTDIVGCTFQENTSSQGGCITVQNGTGGVSVLTVADSSFISNSGAGFGGSAFGTDGCGSVRFHNCRLFGNSGAPVIHGVQCGISLTNCTIFDNPATALYVSGTEPVSVASCILWDNLVAIYDQSTQLVVSYSDVDGGYSGTGNIDAEPDFVDPDGPDDIPWTEDDDLRLSNSSPCIDAGDNDALIADTCTIGADCVAGSESCIDVGGTNMCVITSDLDGAARRVDFLDSVEADPDNSGNTGAFGAGAAIVDMGAYEAASP